MVLRRYIISISVMLLLTFPSMRIATVSDAGFTLPLQNFLSQQEQYTAEGCSPKAFYLKVKSCQDTLSFGEGAQLLSPYPPLANTFSGHGSDPLLFEGAKEIFIPPEEISS